MHFIKLQTYRSLTYYNIKLIIQFIIFEDQEMFSPVVVYMQHNVMCGYVQLCVVIHKMIVLQQIILTHVRCCKNIWNFYGLSCVRVCVYENVIEYVYFCDKKRVSSLIHCMVSYDYYTAYILLSLLLLLLRESTVGSQ